MDLENATEIIQSLERQLQNQEERFQNVAENTNQFFLITNAIIVYFMQCGFAFLECGAVRAKNATNILIKNTVDSFLGAICFWVIGFPFAMGRGNMIIGHEYFASNDLPPVQFAFWFWNFVFAATSTTIVSGALAERCDLAAYLVYTALVTGVIYPITSHWAWGPEGWLKEGLPFEYNNATEIAVYQDFAGSGVVHLLGGMIALAGAVILGPRLGKFASNKMRTQSIPGHSVPLSALGGFILLFGFFSFISGSQIHITEKGDGLILGRAMVNAMLCCASSGLTTLCLQRLVRFLRKLRPTWSLLYTINGGLAGMVAICASADDVEPWSAVCIGVVAGINYMAWSYALTALKIDDPVDAVAVHAGGGSWGLLSVYIFSIKRGVIFNWGKPALMGFAWNLVGLVAISVWGLATGIIMFGLLKYFKILRVDVETEIKGLDVHKHGEAAYPITAYKGKMIKTEDNENDISEDSESNAKVPQENGSVSMKNRGRVNPVMILDEVELGEANTDDIDDEGGPSNHDTKTESEPGSSSASVTKM